ncbi:MAG: hypothetical protein WDA16_05715 [Candidatus Thermoplasmatota archaeon]
MLYVGGFVSESSIPISSIVNAKLKPQAEDFLRTADGLPSDSCGAHNQLEQLIIEGASGQHDFWKERIMRYLGPGMDSAMVLDNVFGRPYTLHGDDELMGSTTDLVILPDFGQPTSMITAPATGVSPMKIDVPSARYSELVRLKGDAVRTTIHTTDITSTRDYQAWSPTAILGNNPRDGIQDIGWNMTNGTSAWNFTKVVGATNLTSYAQGIADFFRIRVNGTVGSSGVRIPAHTSLQVDFPRGWTLEDSPNSNWSLRATESAAGASVTLTATQDVSNGSDIVLLAHPPSNPVHPFDVVRAHAFNGSFGESTLLVQYPVPASPDLPRQLYPTTPYPVRPGTLALFGASFANGGENTSVTQLDFEVPGGYDVWLNRGSGAQLFEYPYSGPIVGVDDHGGTWSIVDARHARWTSSPNSTIIVPALSVSWWGAMLPITTRSDQATNIENEAGTGPNVTLSFNTNTFNVTGTAWGKSPGIISVSVPNMSASMNDGYSTAPGKGAFDVTVMTGSRAYQHATGSFDSDATNAASTDSAAANSTFTVRQRLAPLGSLVRVDANFESVMNQLSSAGVTDSNLTIDLFAPPNFGCAPTHSWNINAKSLPRPAVRALAFMDVVGVGSPDAIIGIADHKLYRVNAQGAALWAAPLSSTAQRLAYWDGGASERFVIAGDDLGMLYSIDAVTGAASWSTCVGTIPCDAMTLSTRGVTSISVDVTRDRIVTTTADGRLTLLDGAGATQAHRSAGPNASYAFAAFLNNGNVLAQNDTSGGALELLDANLQVVQLRLGHWLAIAPNAGEHVVRVASALDELTIDETTLLEVGTSTHFSTTMAITAASGDASGDGVPELVVAMEDKSIWIFDGATNAYQVYNTALDLPKGIGSPDSAPPLEALETCADATQWSYPVCVGPPDMGGQDLNSLPPLLAVGSAGIIEEHVERGGPYVTVLDAQAQLKWRNYLQNGHLPTILASGNWGTDDTVGIGYDDGATDARPTTYPGHPRLTASPSTLAGAFTFTLPIPSGGFFGSHLLVASLSWLDASNTSRSVRLSDWIEVVRPDGAPVTHPAYRATIVFEARDTPIIMAK